MVRPNQIVDFSIEDKTATFLMFAMSENVVKRRVILLNFPSKIRDIVLGEMAPDDFITDVELVTSGVVNRYAVTVDLGEI